MATKSVCDRCGKEINIGKKSWLRAKSIVSEVVVGKRVEVYSYNRDGFYDMCNDCTKAFKLFMNGNKVFGETRVLRTIYPGRDVYPDEIGAESIPADIAQKLGLQQKED